MKNEKGFSLIELLIVVVIIGIIAAIAIPNLLASRRSANEGSTISAMRTLHGAQMTYGATYGSGDYAGPITPALDTTGLGELGAQNLIDSVLAGGAKSGYLFVGNRSTASATAPARFLFSALPATTSGVTQTGARRFGVAIAGVLGADSDLTGHFTSPVTIEANPLNN